MRVKTNFKKMFLVDSLPTNNKTPNDFNDNAILNNYIETQDINNEEIKNRILDDGDKNEDKTSNQINNKGPLNKLIDENEAENENDAEIENKKNTNDTTNQINDGEVENLKDTNNDSIIESNNSPSCKNTTDFNLGKCLNDCFNKSSIKYYNKNPAYIDNEKFNVLNDDDENGDSFMESDDDDENENEGKELLERLERLRNNEKILKGKKRSLLDRSPKLRRIQRIRNNTRKLKNSILSKYKHQNYFPQKSLQSYMNKKVINDAKRNDSIRKLHRNLKRKLLPDEESYVEAKSRKVRPHNESEESDSDMNVDHSDSFDEATRIKTNANIKAIPLLNEDIIDNGSNMNSDFSENSEKDFESNIEDDEIDFEDIEENEKPYSLRKNRKKPQKYQDYIKNYLVCKNCENEFRNEKALENHIKTCKINSFACTFCGKNYKTKWGLQSHLNNMHYQKQNKKKFT